MTVSVLPGRLLPAFLLCLCLTPAAFAQNWQIPSPILPGFGAGSGGAASAGDKAVVIIRCAAVVPGVATTNATPGACSCSTTSVGGSNCSCNSSSADGQGATGAPADWSFSASRNAKADLVQALADSMGGCVDAVAYVKSEGGACDAVQGSGTQGGIVYDCSVPGNLFE